MSEITKYLYFLGVIVWILPAIRHYRSNLFDFFLVLAVIDPVTFLYGIITKTNIPMWLLVLFIYLLIISVLSEDLLQKLRYLLVAIPLIFVVLIPFMTKKYYHFFYVMMDMILLGIFLKWLISYYVEKKKLNLFYLMLVFYMLTVILKFFNLLIGFADATAFFIITTFAQIFFGLFFSIVREDESGIVH